MARSHADVSMTPSFGMKYDVHTMHLAGELRGFVAQGLRIQIHISPALGRDSCKGCAGLEHTVTYCVKETGKPAHK